MGEIRNYIWTFPLLGGILTLIALLTPAVYIYEIGDYIFLWIWGLFSVQIHDYYYDTTYNLTTFTDNELILIPSIICSVFIFVGILALFSSSYSFRKEIKKGNIEKNRGLAPSIIIMISTIAWMISMEISFIVGPGSMSFWSAYNVGFGVIGMFLGAIFGMIGYGVSKYMAKQRGEVKFLPKKGFQIKFSSDPTITASNFNFCPECGQKIISETQRFCMNCRFELRNI